MLPEELRRKAGDIVREAADRGVVVDIWKIFAEGVDPIECPDCCKTKIEELYRSNGLRPTVYPIGPS